MKEAGFIEIFVDNQAQTPVYYDNMRVSMSSGTVMEVNAYYPYGMIIPNLSVSAMLPGEYNAYKYNNKELQTEHDLHWLDYGARMYDPIGRGGWWLPDPLAEKYYQISPYAYCGNNPINFIDPNGMEIDSLSQKQWNKEKSRITSRLDKLENKNKNGRNDERIASLKNTIDVMGTAEESTQLYSLSKVVYGKDGGLTLNPESKAIIISYNGTANFVHEIKHVEQFESKWGHIAFNSETGEVYAQDIYDEVQAYRAQYAYDPSSVTGLTSTSTISSMQQILPAWVQGIKKPDGSLPYALGGYANTGLTPVYLNSTKADLIRAYPHMRNSLNHRSNTMPFKNMYPMYYKR